jgi:hypothetical protein
VITRQTNDGPLHWFTDKESAHYAEVIALMPRDNLPKRANDFLLAMELRFRAGKGGNLTEKQWTWLQVLIKGHEDTI